MEEIWSMAEAKREAIAGQKRQGKPLVVYNSTFVPAELIRAAGANTYMLCHGGEAASAKAALDYTLKTINPFALANAGYLVGNMDEVAGLADMIVLAYSDSHMGRMGELLELKGMNVVKVGIPTDWEDPASLAYYEQSLRSMLEKVCRLTGKPVDPELARREFERTNRVKKCERRLAELRKGDRIPLGIETAMAFHNASFLLDADEEGVAALERYVDRLETAPGVFEKDAPRLLLIARAAAVGDSAVMRLIDECGGAVVAEVIDECVCVSDMEIRLTGDPVKDFAGSRYAMPLPVSSFQPSWKKRFEHVLALIRDYRVDGVLWYQLENDEIYDMEYRCVSHWLNREKIPVTLIETDYDYTAEKLAVKRGQIGRFLQELRERRTV